MQSNELNNQPLVSVAICTYNGERFLAKQLFSILKQTYSNIEIVIVDDGSIDQTVRIAEEFAHKDSRVKYYINETNLGFNKNFEKAVKLCSGDFIAISDQDDIWLSHKVESLLRCIGDKLMVYANSEIIDDDDVPTGRLMIDPFRDVTKYQNYRNLLVFNFVSGHNVFFRKEALNYILPFPENGFYDWWMGFVMLYEHKLAYCNEVLMLYRVHDKSVTTILSKNNIRRYKVEERLVEAETILGALATFQTYKGLKAEDSRFMKDFEYAIKDSLKAYFSIKLFDFLCKNSEQVYPSYDKPAFKRIGLNYRLSRGIKLLELQAKFYKASGTNDDR